MSCDEDKACRLSNNGLGWLPPAAYTGPNPNPNTLPSNLNYLGSPTAWAQSAVVAAPFLNALITPCHLDPPHSHGYRSSAVSSQAAPTNPPTDILRINSIASSHSLAIAVIVLVDESSVPPMGVVLHPFPLPHPRSAPSPPMESVRLET